MKSRILLLMLGVILLISLVAAEDVLYVVTNEPEQAFSESMDELGLSYRIIRYNEVRSVDFADFRMILLNDDYFPNLNEIPVNDFPVLAANSYHVGDWGWATRASLLSDHSPITVDINTQHTITQGFSSNIQVYNHNRPDIYYLDKISLYDGFELVAMNVHDNQDAVIAVAEAGTVLTKGSSETQVNANTVFFGITETEYWTDNTKQLFKNSLLWVLEGSTEFPSASEINLNEGHNLVSFSLDLVDKDVSNLISSNPNIVSIKEYHNGQITEATQINLHKGYFIESNADFTLNIEGAEPTEGQSVLLNEGMNLMGISSLSNIPLGSLPSEVIEVAKRNSDGSYTITTRYDDEWFNEFELEPSEGYWFKLNQGATWIYP